MANYSPLSLLPVFSNGKAVVGAKVYTYRAGTNTPIETFSDGVSGSLHTWPMLTTSNGVIPPFWVGVSNIKVVITTPTDTVIQSIDNIHVVSESTGGGSTPAPATDIPPGFMLPAHTTGAVAGWVRANGLSIGNDVSGATERANADTLALFKVLWAKDTALTVSGGRGASADADFAAGKRINLPDYRGKTLVGLDGMGGPAAGLLAGVSFTSGSSNVLGSYGGAAAVTLTTAQMPRHSHAGSTIADSLPHDHTGMTDAGGVHTHTASTADAGNHSHTVSDTGHTHSYAAVSSTAQATGGSGSNYYTGTTGGTTGSSQTGISIVAGGDHRHTVTVENGGQHVHPFHTMTSGIHTHTLTIADSGTDTAHPNMQPFMLCNIYLKL